VLAGAVHEGIARWRIGGAVPNTAEVFLLRPVLVCVGGLKLRVAEHEK
jgi:hypothetical protein